MPKNPQRVGSVFTLPELQRDVPAARIIPRNGMSMADPFQN
jgi:hypothetical protein